MGDAARGKQARLRRGLRVLVAMGSLLSAGAVAQTSAGTQSPHATESLSYDVAAIRPGKAGNGNWSINDDGDTLSVQNAPVIMILAEAYNTRPNLISGEPHWADASPYDIQAKILNADPEVLKKLSDDQRRVMLQGLLAERFHLKVHTETRTLPVYDLVISKGGVKLREAAVAPALDANPESDKFRGTNRGNLTINFSDMKLEMLAHAVTAKEIASVLSEQVHRTVIDKTGLTGTYDVALTWASEDGGGPAEDTTDASIFTALQEQLGLKLVPAKGPVETLVVDQLEAPTEN